MAVYFNTFHMMGEPYRQIKEFSSDSLKEHYMFMYRGKIIRLYYFDCNGLFRCFKFPKSDYNKWFKNDNYMAKWLDETNGKIIEEWIIPSYIAESDFLRNELYYPDGCWITKNGLRKSVFTNVLKRLDIDKSTVEDCANLYNLALDNIVADYRSHYTYDLKFNNDHPQIQFCHWIGKARNINNPNCPMIREACKDLVNNTDVFQFLISFDTLSIERVPTNYDENTFDFVRVRCSLPHFIDKNKRKDYVQKNLKDIVQVYLAYLSTQKSFTKYEIGTEWLKVGYITITQYADLEILFELKEIPELEERENHGK
jgi:hypothetical protein